MKITDHFTTEEFKHTDHNLAEPIRLTRTDQVKMFYLCNMLEVIRAVCNRNAIKINSGKRTPELNEKIGGAPKSDHLYVGESAAVDFDFYRDKYLLWRAYSLIQKWFFPGYGQVILYLPDLDNYPENQDIMPRFIHLSLPHPKHTAENLVTVGNKYHTISTFIQKYPLLKPLAASI